MEKQKKKQRGGENKRKGRNIHEKGRQKTGK
jgi:hypothetical protein